MRSRSCAPAWRSSSVASRCSSSKPGRPTGRLDARAAPPVSDAVRELLAAGETRKAAKLYMQETGAGIGEATAALGEVAKELRGD